jgi:RNA polymerase sigma-70 factor (ECF subfamily)
MPFARNFLIERLAMNHNAQPAIACPTDPAVEQMLVVAAKNGDEQAFETLFKRHRQKVLRVVLRYAHVREDAEDIVQQSFQKAFVYLHKFEGKSSFSTWLTRIAINEALMLLRHGRALREIPVDDSPDQGSAAPAMEIADASPDPEASYLRRERVQILCKTLEYLRPGMRTAIELREFAELSTEETARRMGISAGAVKARLFHARKKLQGKLSRYMKPNPSHGKGTTDKGDVAEHIRQRQLCHASGL